MSTTRSPGARQKTTAELVSRMDEREPRMADTEDRLRRTMETILDRSGDPEACQTRSPPRDHHRPAEAPEHQRGGDTRRRHRPETDPEPRRHTMDRPGPARRVHRRAANLMEKRARPRSKRPRPRSGRGVRCTRHPCRQASLRVSPRRGAGRPHPPAMGARSVIQWGAAPGPVACRLLGPILWPHVRAAKAIRAVFGPMVEANVSARTQCPGWPSLRGSPSR